MVETLRANLETENSRCGFTRWFAGNQTPLSLAFGATAPLIKYLDQDTVSKKLKEIKHKLSLFHLL